MAKAKERRNCVRFSGADALSLHCGVTLDNYTIAYQTYGTLNADRSNAIMIFHTLTADQYVTGTHPITQKPGWWSRIVGENLSVDTRAYFVICANVLGGCMGSEGPNSIRESTQKIWGLSFPVVTIGDMVRAQVALLDHLGIRVLHTAIGASMGGMQAMYFASKYTDRVHNVIIVATSPCMSPRNIGINEVARQSIMADVNWHMGNYEERHVIPEKGLAIARMAAHISYLSEKSMYQKFGRNLQDKEKLGYSFIESDFQVENYLRYQGKSFVKRFDANAYLYLTKAMDYFDMKATTESGLLTSAFAHCSNDFFIVSISSDWLHPTKDSMELVRALNIVGANVSFIEIQSDAGHDGFLLGDKEFCSVVKGFIERKKI